MISILVLVLCCSALADDTPKLKDIKVPREAGITLMFHTHYNEIAKTRFTSFMFDVSLLIIVI